MALITYLISGANKGIGLGLVQFLLARGDAQVFAGARDPEGATELKALADKHPSKLFIVKLVSADKANNEAAIEEVKKIAGRLDVVIANAGILTWLGPCTEASEEVMLDHFRVNTLGPLILFQTSYDLLKSSTTEPKFMIISAILGSITVGTQFSLQALPIGASKAATNYLARRLHFENEGLIVYPIEPGTADTPGAAALEEKYPWLKPKRVTVEDSVAGVMAFIDKAKREEGGPQHISYDGSIIPW